MRRFVLKSMIAAMTVLALGSAHAQVNERTFKLNIQNPKGHPMEVGAQKLADTVAAKSGGKMKIKVFPGGQLGGDAQTVSALQGGTIEMTVLNSGILAAQVKDFEVYDYPFVFANSKEADTVVDGPFGKNLHAKLEAKNIVGLGYWELGFRNLTNSKRPILKVEDIAGLKLRVIPNPINLDWVKALGANPVPLAFPELYTAMETRAVDSQENPVTVINANKFNEVQKYLTLTRHQYNPQSVIISKKVWDGLTGDEKKIISEAVAEVTVFQRKVAREQETVALDALKKSGMEIGELPPAEVARFREKMAPVIEKHSVGAVAETVAALKAELAKLRK
ncbi:TRAP transporter substrate-binding protein [Dokdonella sp.]|jgi:tripartite ATP-independent transporter DctP family solute receptor|uniref:TRAP transporter substrate-binding protein n=1 Tax=Dokdonella sp. TaxID=2291710 RepID=UPI002DD6B735|nr:TRAP transporter substrate-binding protein [Dokdonella sp.]